MCALVAEAAPWWPPTAFGFHAQTFGFLLGETLQWTTGARLVTLLLDDIVANAYPPAANPEDRNP